MLTSALRRLALATTLVLAAAPAARADVFDRIDRCEQSGGANGCIYDLLRELARDGGGAGQLMESGDYLPSRSNGTVTIYATATSVSVTWQGLNDRSNGIYACSGLTCTHPSAPFKLTIQSRDSFLLESTDGYRDTFTKRNL